MAHSATIRHGVRNAYIRGVPLAQAAKQFGVSEATARAWRDKETDTPSDWDHLKAAHDLALGMNNDTIQEILGRFLTAHAIAIQELDDPKLTAEARVGRLASLTDSLAKTMRALGNAAPELSRLGVAMEVLHLLAEYIKNNHPKLAPSFMDVLVPFGNHLVKEFG